MPSPETLREDRKIDAAIDSVRTYNDWKRAVKAYGTMSSEAYAALMIADAAFKKFRRLNKPPKQENLGL